MLTDALEQSLNALTLKPEDAALAELARDLARAIDKDPKNLATLTPKLNVVLNDLLMTPRSRMYLTTPKTEQEESPLDRIRNARRSATPAVDSSAT